MNRTCAGILLWLMSMVPAFVFAETVKCPCTADVHISSVGVEKNTNHGKAPRLKLKGYQEYALLRFDTKALAGRKIKSATLHVAPEKGRKHAPPERGTDLRWFTITTISSTWNEGLGTNYTVDLDGAGACFDQAKFQKQDWAHPGSKAWDVMQGNGHSLRWDVDGGHPKDGWFSIPVAPRIIQAMVAGATDGLMLQDGSVFISTNAFIHSRESGEKAPYLNVVVEGDDKAAPGKIEDLKIGPASNEAGLNTGALRVSFKVPDQAFAYDVRVNEKAVGRWQIPFAGKKGGRETFVLRYLPPGEEAKVEVRAVSASGVRSEPVLVEGSIGGAISVPPLPLSDWDPKGGEPPTIKDALAVWAFPEISKLDPIRGVIVQERRMEKAMRRNGVWDAHDRTVRILAARGEIAGFNLAVVAKKRPARDLKVSVEGLQDVKARYWRTWFVKYKGKYEADYAIPLPAGSAFAIPAKDNGIEGQKAAVIAVDLIVPMGAKPGLRKGKVILSSPEGKVELALKLDVRSPVIPEELNFIPELNCYRGPLGAAGSEPFFDAFRIAHYHRCQPNRVPHSHSGRTHQDWIPEIDKDGNVTDWSRFDKNLGPLLDGSAFKDNPRAGVPIPVLYLPHNESFPLPIKAHYKPGENVPLVGKGWLQKHHMFAKPPEEAFDDVYKKAFVRNVKAFVKHFEEKGWTRTLAEAYNNNKVQYGKVPVRDKDGNVVKKDGKPVRIPGMTGTAWTLDEPQHLLDWQALKFYSELFHKGITEAKTAKFAYRGDISRPMWQGSYMDGLMEVMVCGGAQFSMLHLMKASKRRMPTQLWAYGSCPPQSKPAHQTTLWCLKTYAHEADGILPWQSIGGDKCFDEGDEATSGNGLIVDGSKRFGVNAIASFRLHAMRQGAQLIELLRLLEQKRKWSRTHSGALMAQKVPLSSQFKQAFADDAAAVTFEDVNGDAFVELKEGVLKLLEE